MIKIVNYSYILFYLLCCSLLSRDYYIINKTPDTIRVKADFALSKHKRLTIEPGQTGKIHIKEKLCLSDLTVHTQQGEKIGKDKYKYLAADGKYKSGNADQKDLLLSCKDSTFTVTLSKDKNYSIKMQPLKIKLPSIKIKLPDPKIDLD